MNFNALFHRYGDSPAVIDATFDNNTLVRIYVGGEEEVHAVVFDTHGQPVKTKAAAIKLDLPIVEILPQIGPLDPNGVIPRTRLGVAMDGTNMRSSDIS